MTIPVTGFYLDPSLGAGKVATSQQPNINSEVAGANIKYGQAVAMQGGQVVPATQAPIYGIAVTRSYTDADRFLETKTDTWQPGETIGVLREGTIAVPLSADVDKGDGATIDADGNFKPAGDGDVQVGIFTTTGNTGDTAFLQTSLAFTSAVGSAASNPSTAPILNGVTANTDSLILDLQ